MKNNCFVYVFNINLHLVFSKLTKCKNCSKCILMLFFIIICFYKPHKNKNRINHNYNTNVQLTHDKIFSNTFFVHCTNISVAYLKTIFRCKIEFPLRHDFILKYQTYIPSFLTDSYTPYVIRPSILALRRTSCSAIPASIFIMLLWKQDNKFIKALHNIGKTKKQKFSQIYT